MREEKGKKKKNRDRARRRQGELDFRSLFGSVVVVVRVGETRMNCHDSLSELKEGRGVLSSA
ncbi:hypothetical protein Syun_006173 [Stephania yunnanensis]|uniref:Uncharacterized protein n=1 Tax=Stephania yunnanensis TaxID=152371 RepID=A0AAP0PXA7_9MAGN